MRRIDVSAVDLPYSGPTPSNPQQTGHNLRRRPPRQTLSLRVGPPARRLQIGSPDPGPYSCAPPSSHLFVSRCKALPCRGTSSTVTTPQLVVSGRKEA